MNFNNEDEIVEPYSNKEFAKDLAIGAAQSVAVTAGSVAILLAAGYGYSKYLDWKKSRKAIKQTKN